MLFKREIQKQISPWLGRSEIIVILGARQVGKTSLIQLLRQELKDEPTFYLDLEDTFNLNICETVDSFINYLSLNGLKKEKKNFCFLDEIQYHPDPTKFLKLLHDHHPYIKMVVTGSSSFEMRRKFKESLVGRKITFNLYPLNFLEYLRFKQSELEKNKNEISLKTILTDFNSVQKFHLLTPQILPLIKNFIILGGYPKIAIEQNLQIKKELLKEIYNTYIQKDIKDLTRIGNVLKFNRLVTFLAVQASNLFRLDEAAKELGIAQKTLENYLFILENTFTTFLLRPYHSNLQKELTKMPKLYFMDNGLRNAMVDDYRTLNLRSDTGAIVEGSCYLELRKNKLSFEKLNFWRTTDGKEVDFILTLEDKSLIPIEVKFKSFPKPDIPAALKYFIKQYQPSHAIVLTKDSLHQVKLNKTQVLFVPLWMI